MTVFDIINRYYTEDGALRSVLLTHSKKVAERALLIAERHPLLPLDRDFLYSAAMLHDIGIIRCDAPGIHCFGTEPYIRHGICGARMLLDDGWEQYFPLDLLKRWARVCERHTGSGLTAEEIRAERLPLPERDFLPETLEEQVVCYADKFFSKTHAEREKPLERVFASMKSYSAGSYERFLRLHEMFK
ncbi:MAG: HD domain-containing protein [Prevotella sp.]|nr:HD domain-containing protein [Prevotella sp.]